MKYQTRPARISPLSQYAFLFMYPSTLLPIRVHAICSRSHHTPFHRLTREAARNIPCLVECRHAIQDAPFASVLYHSRRGQESKRLVVQSRVLVQDQDASAYISAPYFHPGCTGSLLSTPAHKPARCYFRSDMHQPRSCEPNRLDVPEQRHGGPQCHTGHHPDSPGDCKTSHTSPLRHTRECIPFHPTGLPRGHVPGPSSGSS